MSTEEQSVENKGIQSITDFYDKNKNNIMIAGVALIVIAAGIWYYGNVYKPQLESEANASFFMAERYFSTDSLDKALNGDGTNLGLIAIVDEFGSTRAGQQAGYLAGRALLDQGKYEEALEYLDGVSMDDEFLAAQIITLRGDCESELGNYETAGDTYMKAANARENELTTPYALLKAGTAYEEAGEYNSALKAYERLEKEYVNTRHAQNVQAKIARVQAKNSAQ